MKKPLLNDRAYEGVKQIVQLGLPAAGTLYFALAGIWDWSNAEQVIGTIAALNVFLGVLLTISSREYKASDERFDGTMDVIEQANGKMTFSLNLNGDPEELLGLNEVIFKVVPSQEEVE